MKKLKSIAKAGLLAGAIVLSGAGIANGIGTAKASPECGLDACPGGSNKCCVTSDRNDDVTSDDSKITFYRE